MIEVRIAREWSVEGVSGVRWVLLERGAGADEEPCDGTAPRAPLLEHPLEPMPAIAAATRGAAPVAVDAVAEPGKPRRRWPFERLWRRS